MNITFKGNKIEFCKKNKYWILSIFILSLLLAVSILTIVNNEQTINQLKNELSEKRDLIKLSFQKKEGNVYPDYIHMDKGTLYIPVLYRGKIITLVTSNYTNYRDYNTDMLYAWIDNEYYTGNYGCVGFNIMAIAGADMKNPFSTEYADASCTGDGTAINLDLPLSRENEYYSSRFSLGRIN